MLLDINQVSQITGLTAFTIRAWEKRYGAIRPARDGRERIFTLAEVERLKTLKELVALGHPIRRASQMTDEQIIQVLPSYRPSLEAHRDQLLSLLTAYRLQELSDELHHHRVRRGVEEFLVDLVTPLMREVGHLVQRNQLSVAQEHAVTALVRDQIVRIRATEVTPGLPLMGFCTPEGDLHELGILMASKLSQARGYPTAYFGPNLPAEALADICRALRPSIVVIGTAPIVSNLDQFESYLATAGRQLKPRPSFWIAGAMASVASSPDVSVTTMREFVELLDQGRS